MAGPDRIRTLPQRSANGIPQETYLDGSRIRMCGGLTVSVNRNWRVDPDTTAASDAPFKAAAPVAFWSHLDDHGDVYLAAVAAHDAYWLGFEAETGTFGVLVGIDGTNPLTAGPTGPGHVPGDFTGLLLVPDQPWLDSRPGEQGRLHQLVPDFGTSNGVKIGAEISVAAFSIPDDAIAPGQGPDPDEIKPLYAPGPSDEHPWQHRTLVERYALPAQCGRATILVVLPEAFRDLTGAKVDLQSFRDEGPAPEPFDPFR